MKCKKLIALVSAALIIAIGLGLWLPFRMNIGVTKDIISISFVPRIVYANPAISIRATGTPIYGTANLTPVIPTAQLVGDMMLCLYGTKPYSDAPTINQSWTSIGSATDGTVAAGVDVGSMQTRIFYKIATADPETDPTVTNSTNNVSTAVIIVFQKGASEGWFTPVGAGGGDATAGTNFSVTVSSDVGHTTGDMVVAAASFPSDAATPTTARAVSITGCTLGTYVQSPATDPETTSGGDMGMTCGYRPVNSGTSSAAPVMTATLGAAHTGSAYLVRLRAFTPAITVNPTFCDFGIVTESSTPSTTTTSFTIDNTSTGQTDQMISVTTTTWSGGVGWAHSDTATPGTNQAGLKANKGGTWETGDIIVKYNTPNFITENQAANTDYSFGLKLIAPISFTDGVQKQIIVRITAIAG